MSDLASTEKEVQEETKAPVKESAADEGETTQNETPAHKPGEEPKIDMSEQALPSQPAPPLPAAQNETPAHKPDEEPKIDTPEQALPSQPAPPLPAAQNETPAHKPGEEPKIDTPEQALPSQLAPPLPAAPKIKHDWYQTHSDVYINVMIKRLKRDDVAVDFTEKSIKVQIQLGEGKDCSLTFQLAHHIVPQKSSFKVLSTKVEVKMRKAEGLQWPSLEGTEEQGKQHKLPQMEEAKDDVHKYPSSSHYTRNWDKLVAEVKQEEKDEKLEGDAALNKLFQQIYSDGSDEVKKAMNKSFSESGGTVLSTNWGEVGSKNVERKPPEGMEWKPYEN